MTSYSIKQYRKELMHYRQILMVRSHFIYKKKKEKKEEEDRL